MNQVPIHQPQLDSRVRSAGLQPPLGDRSAGLQPAFGNPSFGSEPLRPKPIPNRRFVRLGWGIGAPVCSRLPQAGQRSGQAFTLIEIMVVVVILGILAATIIPQFMGTTHEARVNTAKANVAQLESALERFHIHMDRYPTTEEGLNALVEPPSADEKRWRGPYVTRLRPDPWGNPFQYRNPGVQHKSGFDLWSRGADGADGGEGEGADIGNW